MSRAEGSGRLERIVRYPVKGLAGASTTSAHLVVGHGLRHDRALAIERGSVPVDDPHGWNPRETYFHVAKDAGIVRLRTKLVHAEGDRATLLIDDRDGARVRVRLDEAGFEADRDAADRLLRGAIDGTPASGRMLARTGVGLWDWPDAHLSLINIATLRELGQAAGRHVSWQRFRANLYIDGLAPWAELAMLGTRVRIGTTTLEIVQATERCRATTINPDSAESDVNIPALLASRFGHLYCGVYARVVEDGDLHVGDEVRIEPEGSEHVRFDEPEVTWPRASTLLRREAESSDVTSFWLSDPLEMLPSALAGQHLRVHLADETAPSWRCYTISGREEGRVRISVKRDGRVSTALHRRLQEGDQLLVSGPFGDVTLAPGTAPVVLLSAGVGVTPTTAMLRTMASDPGLGSRPVRVLHVDRLATDAPLLTELRSAVAALPDARLDVFASRDTPEIAAAHGMRPGRPGLADFTALLSGLDPATLTVYACGPDAFTDGARATLGTLGVPAESVLSEVFFSPTTAALADPRPPSTAGPHLVTDGEASFTWTAESGSLLDAAEGAGLAWPSGCRAGACGMCAKLLRSGEVEYLTEPLSPPARGRVLVCCSAPVTAVVFAEAST